MTHFFDTVFKRYPVKTKRALEILPGFMSWTLILFPIWGALVIPSILAYFVLFFDVFWFYKSFSLVITAYLASKNIKKAEKVDWGKFASDLPDFGKVTHIAILP